MENKKVMPFDKMMKLVSDLVEEELKLENIYYKRDGTVFSVERDNMSKLMALQYKANAILFDSGEFTKDMVVEM